MIHAVFRIFVSYLYTGCSGFITSVGEERANFPLSFTVCLEGFPIPLGACDRLVILLLHFHITILYYKESPSNFDRPSYNPYTLTIIKNV